MQRRLEQIADFQIAALRFFRQAGVGEKQGDVRVGAGVHEVGPDFRFHQYAEQWAVFLQELGDPFGFVVRQVTALRVGEQFFRGGASGRRHLGHEQRRVGEMAAQRFHQRLRGAGFADRYGMHPNRMLHRPVKRFAETLAPMVEIGRRFDGALFEIVADKRRRDAP